jgi:4'-phosphopantetheinyl transferase
MKLLPNEIYVWRVFLPDVQENQLDKLHAILSEKEREKAARFHRELDRKSSVVARGALRTLLASYTGVPAIELEFSYSENGKPELSLPQEMPPISFNLSHSGEWVLLAFGQGGRVGIDIEKIKSSVNLQAISERYFTAEDASSVINAANPKSLFYKLWTQKEAYVKACGSTLFRELHKKIDATIWKIYNLKVDSRYAATLVSEFPASNITYQTFSC